MRKKILSVVPAILGVVIILTMIGSLCLSVKSFNFAEAAQAAGTSRWSYNVDGIFSSTEWATVYKDVTIGLISGSNISSSGKTQAQLKSTLQGGYNVNGANAWTIDITRYYASWNYPRVLRMPGSDMVYNMSTDIWEAYNSSTWTGTKSDFGKTYVEVPAGSGTYAYQLQSNAVGGFSAPVGAPMRFFATANSGYSVSHMLKATNATPFSAMTTPSTTTFTPYKLATSAEATLFNDSVGHLYTVWQPQIYTTKLWSDSAGTKTAFAGKRDSYGLVTLRYIRGNSTVNCNPDAVLKTNEGYVNGFRYSIMSDAEVKNPTRIGYTFNGWVDKSNGSRITNLVWMSYSGVTGDRNYYESWTANPVTVNYKANKPAESIAYVNNNSTENLYTDSITFDATLTNMPIVNLIGYDFKGYVVNADASSYYGHEPNTAANPTHTNDANTTRYISKTDGTAVGNGTKYLWNNGTTQVSGINAYAVWALESGANGTGHKISFDLNKPVKGEVEETKVINGTEKYYQGTASSSIVSTGINPINIDWQGSLPSNVVVPTLTGWDFKGWYVRLGEDTLYKNFGGAFSTDTAVKVYDANGNLQSDYAKYYFHNNKDGVNITLYARWEPKLCSVTFNRSSITEDFTHTPLITNVTSENRTTSKSYNFYYDHTVDYAWRYNTSQEYLFESSTGFTTDGNLYNYYVVGWDFLGWYNGNTKLSSNDVWRELNRVDFVPKFKAHEFSILFKPYTATSGLDVTPLPKEFQYNSTSPLPTVTKTAEGVLVTFKYDSYYKFPASWFNETRTVTFDGQGGTTPMSAVEVYNFVGWHFDTKKQNSGNAMVISSGTSSSNNFVAGDYTLFGGDTDKWSCSCKFDSTYDMHQATGGGSTGTTGVNFNIDAGKFYTVASGTGCRFNLSPVNGTVVECIPIFESAGIVLPDSQKSDAHFGGWYDYTQRAVNTDVNNDDILDYALLSSGKCYGAAGQSTRVNGAYKYSGYFHGIGVYGGQSSYSDIRNYSASGRTSLQDNTGRHCNYTLYAWWNRKPVYVDVYDNIFREGQLVTVDDLYKLVAVYDYEDDYYNETIQKIYNLPTAYLEDIYMDKTPDDSPDDESADDGNDEDSEGTPNGVNYDVTGDEDVTEPEDVDNMYPGWEKVTGVVLNGMTLDVYKKDGVLYYTPEAKLAMQDYLLNASSLEIQIEEIIYFTKDGIDNSANQSAWEVILFNSSNSHGSIGDVQHSWLSTSTSRLVKSRGGVTLASDEWYGDFAIRYTVTDKGLSLIEDVLGANYGVEIPDDLLQCTVKYLRYGKIVYNSTPQLSTYNIIDSVDQSWLKNRDSFIETICNSAFTMDREDCITNIPWWTKAEAYNALRSTLYIESISDILFNATYEAEHSDVTSQVRAQLNSSSDKIDFVVKLFSGNITINGINSSKIAPYIESLVVTYNCHDQFGKYATGGITSDHTVTKPASDGTNYSIQTEDAWVRVEPDTENAQDNVDRSSLLVLINSETDYEMQTANIREEVRFISSDWVFTLGNESYWGNDSYGLQALTDVLNLYEEVKAGNVVNQPQHYTGVYNRCVFDVNDKVDVNIYDYTN